MEIRKDKGRMICRGMFACLIVFCACFIAGCGERFDDDLSCVWVSEAPRICLPPEGFPVVIDVEGVDQTQGINALSDSGRGYLYFTYGNKGEANRSEEYTVWEGEATVKGDKLYLKIVKDYVSDYEGETIVLEKHFKEESK